MLNIAIIGSGPTGIYSARYLLAGDEPVSITMYEAQTEAGKGTPYHQHWNDKEMLANIASIELPPVCESLNAWLERQTDDTLADMGLVCGEIDERAFYPRVVLGEYFHNQLQQLIAQAKTMDTNFTLKTRHEVLDVEVVGEYIELTVRENGIGLARPQFDYVIMATGHVWPKHSEIRPGYFLSPWPANALGTIGHVPVGIRGTSLSAIDAAVALAVARGEFYRQENGTLVYEPEPGTEGFTVTMMSRKGLLPEADFYYPLPYEPLRYCTAEAVDRLMESGESTTLLDDVFALFKQEIMACDPAYAAAMQLDTLSLEAFSHAYFHEREQEDAFIWAAKNLAEAQRNSANAFTVPWRYAILRMHEVIGRILPHLTLEDHQRFSQHFKHVFVDDYATVPHESIERLLALHRAGKLEILRLGEGYALDTEPAEGGASLTQNGHDTHFPAFIEATGQRALSAHEFPFPTLWKQGLIQNATAPHAAYTKLGRIKQTKAIGGIALDANYHPLSDVPAAQKLYCLSLPFMLSMFPFSQGITSSHEMGKEVAEDIMQSMTDTAQFTLSPVVPPLAMVRAS